MKVNFNVIFFMIIFMSMTTAQTLDEEHRLVCGNFDFGVIPKAARQFAIEERGRDEQYGINLAFQIIYGRYAYTDITLYLTINEHFEGASFLVFDTFTKHYIMDDWMQFTEPNQSIGLTIADRAGPHYLRIYAPHDSAAVSGYIVDENNNVLSSWGETDFLTWQSGSSSSSVYIQFDTGPGDTDVGNTPDEEIMRAVERLNYRHQNSNSPFHFEIDTIHHVHNNSWAMGEDLYDTWESVYELSYNPTEILNIFTVIGFHYNLGLGGVGVNPWYLESWDSVFYRVSMKGIYLTDLSAEEGRDHVFDHEVGHSLGLLHTFNYGCDLGTHGDYVLDTPTHAYANYVCDYSVDSCPDDPGNDPVDNCMNYVYGSECQMGFTVGQHGRSLWAIEQWVPTLIDLIDDVTSVPEDYTTIQEALDSAETGYTIHVSPGTYVENIIWPNTGGLRLIGSGPDSTIIDGNQTNRVIEVDDDASPPSEISGFTITNGNTTGRGGGIEIEMTGDILLSNLVISNNQASSGGGIVVEGIGGAWMGEAHVTVENVVFSGNHATGNGGGFSAHEDFVSTLFKSVTFANNTADGSGGGMNFYSMGNYAVILNSIIWNNTPDNLYGPHLFPYFSNIENGYDGVEIMNSDPLFVSDEDLRLQAESPCIDAGSAYINVDIDPTLMIPGEMWMEGVMVDLTPAFYGGNAPDMGAYESPYTAPLSLNEEISPLEYRLYPPYPNPFNPFTTLRYDLQKGGHVHITIYDILGRRVKTLINSRQTAGYKSVQWNARNDAGTAVSPGVYLYTIETGDPSTSPAHSFRQTRKMVLMK
ncbi:MAG TPA: T9SS type A sorting domain-containing protein [Candidatus Marinimicrobia bacterium]|nr:T9SS type A sorting domain-containing protein [Candidatus Neomarinimicrobiota bacterium]